MSALYTYDEPMPYDMSPDEMHDDRYCDRALATYGDDNIDATFSAKLTATDDGAGRPCVEVDDVDIEALHICGVKVCLFKLRAQFPDLYNALCELGKERDFSHE